MRESNYLKIFNESLNPYKAQNDETQSTKQQVVIVSKTDQKPKVVDGVLQMESPFYSNGGLSQNGNEGVGLRLAIHFYAGASVVDHTLGKWGKKKYTVYAPLRETIAQNGSPETVHPADIAFVNTDSSNVLKLPCAVCIEKVDPTSLQSLFLDKSDPVQWRMAAEITIDNKDDLMRILMEVDSHHHRKDGELHCSLNDEIFNKVSNSIPLTTIEINEVMDVIALDQFNTLSLDKINGSHGVHGGFPIDELRYLPSAVSKFAESCGYPTYTPEAVLHGSSPYTTNELRPGGCVDLHAINAMLCGNETHPDVKKFIPKLLSSSFYAELRNKAISDALNNTSGKEVGEFIAGDSCNGFFTYGVDEIFTMKESYGLRITELGSVLSKDEIKNFITHASKEDSIVLYRYFSKGNELIQKNQQLYSEERNNNYKVMTEMVISRLMDLDVDVQNMLQGAPKPTLTSPTTFPYYETGLRGLSSIPLPPPPVCKHANLSTNESTVRHM